MDGELRDSWDLDRDTEEPKDNVLPVKKRQVYFSSHTVSDQTPFFISFGSRLTPGAALRGPGQAPSSQGLCRGLTGLLILAPKQPPPLVSLESPATNSAQVIFTSGGHRGQRAATVALVVR